MINYETANKIVAFIPDEYRSAFWKVFDKAQGGDNEAIRSFQIFVALYKRI